VGKKGGGKSGGKRKREREKEKKEGRRCINFDIAVAVREDPRRKEGVRKKRKEEGRTVK